MSEVDETGPDQAEIDTLWRELVAKGSCEDQVVVPCSASALAALKAEFTNLKMENSK